MFKKIIFLVLALAFVSGCTATQKGAAVGAVTGAAIGGVVGHQSGHGGEGAAIGAAAGAVGGAIIGSQMESKKFCPTCGRQFSPSAEYCSDDGTELKPVEK